MRDSLVVTWRLTAQRKPRAPMKEALIGVGIGTMLAVGSFLNPDWTLWGVLLYLAVVQAISVTHNEVFASFGDFRRLGFTGVSLHYRVLYAVHYVARDLHLALGLGLSIGLAALLLAGHSGHAVLLTVLCLATLWVLPSHVHLAERLSDRARVGVIAAHLIAVLALIAPLAQGWSPGRMLSGMAIAVAACALLYSAGIDRWARRSRANGLTSYRGRRGLVWVTRLSPHLFKDLVLFRAPALQSLVLGLALYALLAVGSPPSFLPALVALALCHDNLFLARRDKRYRLVGDDTLFRGERLPADADRLQRSKFVTVALDVPVKLAVAAALLAAAEVFRADLLVLLAMQLIVGYVICAPLPFLDDPLARYLRGAVCYALVVVLTVVCIAGVPVWQGVIGLLIPGAFYLPSFFRTLIGRPVLLPTPAVTRVAATTSPQGRVL